MRPLCVEFETRRQCLKLARPSPRGVVLRQWSDDPRPPLAIAGSAVTCLTPIGRNCSVAASQGRPISRTVATNRSRPLMKLGRLPFHSVGIFDASNPECRSAVLFQVGCRFRPVPFTFHVRSLSRDAYEADPLPLATPSSSPLKLIGAPPARRVTEDAPPCTATVRSADRAVPRRADPESSGAPFPSRRGVRGSAT